MRKILLDTDVLVDYMQAREPFVEKALSLVTLAYTQAFELWVTSLQVAKLVDIMASDSELTSMKEVYQELRKLRKVVHVIATGAKEIDKMLCTNWKNAEASLLYQCALSLPADVIITRKVEDFEKQKMLVCIYDSFFDGVWKDDSFWNTAEE